MVPETKLPVPSCHHRCVRLCVTLHTLSTVLHTQICMSSIESRKARESRQIVLNPCQAEKPCLSHTIARATPPHSIQTHHATWGTNKLYPRITPPLAQNSFSILTSLPPTPSLLENSVRTITDDWIPPARYAVLHASWNIPVHSSVPVSFSAMISRPVVAISVVPVCALPSVSIATAISFVPVVLHTVVTSRPVCIAFAVSFSWVCCVFCGSSAVPRSMAFASVHVVGNSLSFTIPISVSFAVAVTMTIGRIW
jgi:hypothetical protein